ncbi:unnamed protein product [Polarella glacialis]|uniref:Ankyrin repeat protein n=1 Tax=Polarella glacialis TaxID=89957 RepID=A0A813F2N8_POLGL|nr:unnamed protein product [Polarella glacialis]
MASLVVEAANQEVAMKAVSSILDFVAAAIMELQKSRADLRHSRKLERLNKFAQAVATGGLHIDATDSNGMTLMHYAARHGIVEAVQHLSQLGKDFKSPLRTPMNLAVEHDQLEVVKVLASAVGSNLSGALHVATSLSMVMMLVKLGVDLNEEVYGERPLSPFVQDNKLDIVRCLVSAKSDPHAGLRRSGFGKTALHMATFQYRSPEMVKFLIDEVWANVFETDQGGRNAMGFALRGCEMMTEGRENKQVRELVEIIKRGACRQFAAFMDEQTNLDYVSKETVSRLENSFGSDCLSCPACSAVYAGIAHFCYACKRSLALAAKLTQRFALSRQ